MRKLAWISVVAAGIVLTPALARAQQKAKTGFEFGGRLGYGIPMGKIDGDSDLSDGITGQVPIWFDAGARITPNLFLGGYFGFGVGIAGDTVDDACEGVEALGADCSVTAVDLRFGLQTHYHFIPDGETDPWIGAGVGYEVAGWGYNIEGGGQELDLTFAASGWEFFNLQAGVDFRLNKNVAIGPFAAFSLGQYGDADAECSGDCEGVTVPELEIEDKALHQWLFLGARITILP